MDGALMAYSSIPPPERSRVSVRHAVASGPLMRMTFSSIASALKSFAIEPVPLVPEPALTPAEDGGGQGHAGRAGRDHHLVLSEGALLGRRYPLRNLGRGHRLLRRHVENGE